MVATLGDETSTYNGTVNTKKLAFWIIALLVFLAAFGLFCGRQKQPPRAVQPIERVPLQASDRHDLSADEARGGHTLERHIGKTDSELRERLENESISADSTYTDRATAEMAVAAVIHENSSKIDHWLHRKGGHSNLVLDYDSTSSLGRSIHHRETESFPCSHAVVILKWLNPSEYYVLTSYPDCWRER